VPAGFEALVLGCLEKEPIMRPRSMVALRAAIDRLDVEPWTDAVARNWWRERAHRVREARARREEQDGARTTVVVDLSDRRKAAGLDSTQSVRAQ
jgi:hypothetical protein